MTAFTYEPWRHGGWYVNEVRYPSGAVGCVSRNFPDKKWRIACDDRPGSFPGGENDHTYPSREAAAAAEKEIADAQWEAIRRHPAYELYRKVADVLPRDVCQELSSYIHVEVKLRVAARDSLRASREAA